LSARLCQLVNYSTKHTLILHVSLICVAQTAPDVSPGAFRYYPEDADNIVMPSRATPYTFKGRHASGDENYATLKAAG